MSKIETVLWKDLKFKYSPNDNYHGTCYYGALRLLLGEEFESLYKEVFVKDVISNHAVGLNHVNPLSKWANKNKEYRFGDPKESYHDEEGVIWFKELGSNESHIIYFKNGEYYDDYMSISTFKEPVPILIIVKQEKKK